MPPKMSNRAAVGLRNLPFVQHIYKACHPAVEWVILRLYCCQRTVNVHLHWSAYSVRC